MFHYILPLIIHFLIIHVLMINLLLCIVKTNVLERLLNVN